MHPMALGLTNVQAFSSSAHGWRGVSLQYPSNLRERSALRAVVHSCDARGGRRPQACYVIARQQLLSGAHDVLDAYT